jgi:hypothetical protein
VSHAPSLMFVMLTLRLSSATMLFRNVLYRKGYYTSNWPSGWVQSGFAIPYQRSTRSNFCSNTSTPINIIPKSRQHSSHKLILSCIVSVSPPITRWPTCADGCWTCRQKSRYLTTTRNIWAILCSGMCRDCGGWCTITVVVLWARLYDYHYVPSIIPMRSTDLKISTSCHFISASYFI